jgi:serine/threonine protein kinase
MSDNENNNNFVRKYFEKRRAEMSAAAAGAAAAAAPAKPNYKKLFNTLRSSNNTLLGKGGFGSVRRTRNASALKRVIFDKTANLGNNIGVSKINAFNKEVAALTDLKTIPSVIQIQNSNRTDKNGYILTELFATGASLDKGIEMLDDMDDDMFKKFVKNLLKGLDAIHDAAYLHLDIKPENIWVFPNGTIKYMDFGLACKMPCTKTELYGTPGFTQVISPRADGLYSFSKTSDYYSIIKVLESLKREISKERRKAFLQRVIDTLGTLTHADSAMDAYSLIGGGSKTRRKRRIT